MIELSSFADALNLGKQLTSLADSVFDLAVKYRKTRIALKEAEFVQKEYDALDRAISIIHRLGEAARTRADISHSLRNSYDDLEFLLEKSLSESERLLKRPMKDLGPFDPMLADQINQVLLAKHQLYRYLLKNHKTLRKEQKSEIAECLDALRKRLVEAMEHLVNSDYVTRRRQRRMGNPVASERAPPLPDVD